MSLLCGCFAPPKNSANDDDLEAYTKCDNTDKEKDVEIGIADGSIVEKEAPVSDSLNELKHSDKETETSARSSFRAEALIKLRDSNIPELNQVIDAFTDSGVQSLIDSGEIDDAMAQELAGLISRLESVTTKLESVASKTGFAPSSVEDELPPTVLAFDAIINGPLKTFLDHSKTIGGDVAKQAEMVSAAFQAEKSFLIVAAQSKQPEQEALSKLLGPTSEQIQSAQNFREQNRKSQYFNHLSALSESLPALGWVAVSPAPAPYVKEMNDAGQFYTNRVLKDWKEKDKIHAEWVKTWIQVLNELQAYVKQHHTTGLTWNPQGGVASSVPKPAQAKAAGVPPPPGPPPPPPMGGLDMSAPPKGANADETRNQLFAELNKGEGVTQGLKKVTSDMQTHKNPSLRSGPAPFKPSTGSNAGAPVAPAKTVDKPPKFTLDGKKWIVEYQKNQPNLTIAETEMNQVVYMFKCENSTIQIKGKLNSIVVDSCKKTAIVFDSVVSSVEFVNCQSVQVQVLGSVPTVSIDKTDGCQIYLSAASLKAQIVSAKSSEMNILVPKDDGDYVEFAVPEQYRTTYNGKGLTTVVSDIA